MNPEKYIADIIEKEFGPVRYQLWRHEGLQGKIEIIDGFQWEVNYSAPDCDANKGRYFIKKESEYTELHFNYSNEKGFVLRVLKHLEGINEELVEQLFYALYIYILEGKLYTKTIEQKVLVESMHSISSNLNLDDVLRKIIRHALNVLPTSDAGYLMLYDFEKQMLIPKAPVGFNDNIYQFETKIGESITGKVFEDGRSRVYNSYNEIIAGMNEHNILSDNFDNISQSAGKAEGLICVPISIDDNRIGVMIIHQWKIKKRLDQADITLLEAFARQAAIAIENAQNHAEIEGRLQQITNLSAQLKEKHNQLQKRQEVHQTLTMLSLENKGIRNVVDGMQNMIEQNLIFFNGLENEFYSSRNNEKIEFSVYEIKTLCLGRRRDFYVDTDNQKYFYFYPIYNGEIFIGCLIISFDMPISEFDQITVEQGSTVLALELVNRQTATKIYHRRMYEQFNKLVAMDNKENLMEYGEELNLDVNGYWAIVALEISSVRNNLQYFDIHVHQLASQINKELGDRIKIMYGHYKKVYLLLSLSTLEEVYEIEEKLNHIRIDEKYNDDAIFRGGISSVYKGLEFIRKCYDEANKTISYLANYDSFDVTLYDNIGLNQLFLNQPSGDIKRFIEETLSPLDEEKSRIKELEKTLFTYMEENRSPSKTAKLLHIHINTLYQRIQTIERLLKVDLNDSQDALKIQLACHLKKSRLVMGDV